jgi:hypothetical protein
VAKAVREHQVALDAELHGYELFQGTGWWKGIPPRARIGVYNEAFEALGKCSEAIILRGVRSAGLRKRYASPEPPHSVVLRHLLERVDEYAKNHGRHAQVIADEVGEQARHRSDLAMYRESGTWGYRARKLERIVDTLHFAPSSASRLLHAVDLVVFMHRRLQTHAESNDKAKRANERLWQRIENKIHHSGVGTRQSGRCTKAPHQRGLRRVRKLCFLQSRLPASLGLPSPSHGFHPAAE